jgi:hypothetical protein
MFLPQPTGSEAEPSKEVVELLAPSVSDSEELPTPKPAQIEAIPPVSIEAEPLPLPEAPPQDIGQSDVPENELAEVVGPEETSTVENEAPLAANELGGSSEGQDVATATDEQLPPSVSSVMFKLRLRVVQSLTSLVGVFEPDSPDPQAVHSMFRASARFTARYGFSESVANGSLTQNSQIDARV